MDTDISSVYGFLKLPKRGLFMENVDTSTTPLTTTAILQAAGGNVATGQKRVFAQVGNDKPKKKKNKKAKVQQGPIVAKNALMQLNEIKPGLVYNVGPQEGPVHSPLFKVTVEVNGQMFEGQGVSKKKAKLDVAEKALASFVQLPNAAQAAQALGTEDGDFTNDQGEGSGFSNFDGNKTEETNGTATNTKVMAHVGIPVNKPPQPAGKNPVMILNEIRPGTQYEFVSESGDHILKCFTMQVVIDGKEFTGEGRSKKQAKARAAQAALKEIYNLEFTNPPEDKPEGLPYFTGTDDAWMKHKASHWTTSSGQKIEYDGKNPVQKLNELYRDVLYEVHEPEGAFRQANIFRVTVTVEGEEYEGMANNKKMAKLSAATSALEGLAAAGILDMKEAQVKSARLARDQKQREFIQRMREKQMMQGGDGPLFPKYNKKPIEERGLPGPTNPCTRLNERFRGAQYKIVGELGKYPNQMFTVQCVIQGVAYLGAGKNKKIAKYNAAEKAMRAKNIWTDADERNKGARERGEPETAVDPPELAAKLRPVLGVGSGGGRGGRGGGRGGFQQRGGGRGGFRGGAGGGGGGFKNTFGSNASSNSGGGFPFKTGGGGGGADTNGRGGKFKSVLKNQWTNFKKGSELGSGMYMPNKGGVSMGGASSTASGGGGGMVGRMGMNSPKPKPQYQQQHQQQSTNQDFTSDAYSYDNNSQPTSSSSSQQYSYGYGSETPQQQQQNFNYQASAYTSGYQNPNYGYGYESFSSGSGYSGNTSQNSMYAQGHSY